MSLTIDVQYDIHKWRVNIPLTLCEAKDSSQIFAQVRAAAPPSTGLPTQAQLQFLTSTGAKWTDTNISELSDRKYIQLRAAEQPVAVSRQIRKRLLPASGVLTRPSALPDVSGHLAAEMYIACEYIDNSIKALKGIQDGGKRKIILIYQLAEPSHPLGRKYLAFLDFGGGMSEADMERWASTGTVPVCGLQSWR
ncbi:hypothetical protein ABBQ38_006957 [Trebouxia sp. C0009 RCD-2024]